MDANPKISWARALEVSGWMSAGAVLAFTVLGFIGPIHFGKDAPAWVQAVGSILGIGVAIAVPWEIAHRERTRVLRAAELRSRSYALLLITHVDELRRSISSVRYVLQPAHHHEFDRALDQLLPSIRGDWILQIHELGEAAAPLQSALNAAAYLAKLLGEWESYQSNGYVWIDWESGDEFVGTPPGDIGDSTDRAAAFANEAVRQVRALLN